MLKDISEAKAEGLSNSEIKLSNPLELEDWKQSHNSPSHIGLYIFRIANLKNLKRIVKGKTKRGNANIFAQLIISKNKLFF